MSNSPLVSYTKISPNKNSPRNKAVDRITPHCVVGQCTVERIGEIFASSTRQASSNYGIGLDGKIGMYCDERDRSWCSSSGANDNRAITIECASDTKAPYAMNTKVYNALIGLCVDICQRHGKKKLLWLVDKDKTLSYTPKKDEMILTVHRWFANKTCPTGYDFRSRLMKSLKDRLSAEHSAFFSFACLLHSYPFIMQVLNLSLCMVSILLSGCILSKRNIPH